MSGVASPASAPPGERILTALEPSEAYLQLAAVLREGFGHELLAAYLLGNDERLVQDDAFTPIIDLPTELDPSDTIPAGEIWRLDYAYRGRPLGSLVLRGTTPSDAEVLCRFVEECFAPAYFRTAWLEDTLEENGRLHDQIYFLREIGSLQGHTELEPLLLHLLELTCSFLGADLGSIVLYDREGDLATMVDFGLPHEALTSLKKADGEPVLASALAEGHSQLLTNKDFEAASRGEYRPEQLLILPLRASTEVLGSINLVADVDSARLQGSALEMTRSAVGLAANAIENAMLFSLKLEREREQEQMALAQRIQQSLLPTCPPEIGGLELTGSSDAATMIGGDYFDYVELLDQNLGLVIADVAGKGVAAGLIMTVARAAFRSAALHRSSPAQILTRVNRLLCAEDFGGRFVTAMMVSLDVDNGDLCYAAAGHEPVLLLRDADGSIESLGTRALPLGIRDHTEYTEGTAKLEAGDVLVLHTDGVTEAMDNDRVMFGTERLHETLRGCRGYRGEQVHAAILEAIQGFIKNAPQHDDTTLMVARFLPPSLEEDDLDGPEHPAD